MLVSVVGANGFIGRTILNSVELPGEPWTGSVEDSKEVLYCLGRFGDASNAHQLSDILCSNVIEPVRFLEENGKSISVFNYLSSNLVYGSSDLPWKETDSLRPIGSYAISKALTEHNIAQFCTANDIPFRILRLSNVIGVEDKRDTEYRNSVQFMINKIIREEDVRLIGGESLERDIIFIYDLIKIIALIVRNGKQSVNQVFNAGNGLPVSILKLLERVKDLTGSSSKIIGEANIESNRALRANPDVTKIMELGYKPCHILNSPYFLEYINGLKNQNTKQLT